MSKLKTVSPDDMLPTLYLSGKILPEIAKWRNGGKYRLIVDVEQVGSSINDYEGKKSLNATLKILSVKPVQTDISKDAIIKRLSERSKS